MPTIETGRRRSQASFPTAMSPVNPNLSILLHEGFCLMVTRLLLSLRKVSVIKKVAQWNIDCFAGPHIYIYHRGRGRDRGPLCLTGGLADIRNLRLRKEDNGIGRND
jgi:hypothetical protein